ncbi:integral membrane protein [Colletotrichum gloeosporioides Cg-14]|uniref:Integral membrane protein n=1 Tax=Colletotrichum gloeosporioides (strain Cg-14) TaxID=1237896 RepID=T0MA99_COLGC|nr:integral membrane protein [Colletotrichum gloeosporioides Cg-14]
MSDAWRAENKGPESLVAIVTVTVLSTIFTGARLFVRGKILGKVHLDDYLIIASVICSWVSVATAIVAVAYGMGLHFDTLTRDQQQKAIFWTIVGFPAGVMSFGLPKLAVVALLTRILNPSPWHKKFLWGLSLFCLLNLTANMVLLFTHCQPPRSQWDFDVPSTCLDKWILVSFAIYTGSFGAFVDAYLAIYPAVVLSKLQMSLKKKIALSVALGIGSISTVVAIYKCTRVPSLASQDFTYETADLVIWTIVEGGTMIIAACIPILQPLSELIFGKRLFSSGGGRRTYENYGSGPSGQMRSENIELSRGHKRTPRQQDTVSFDDLDTTTTTAVAKGSQESILGQHSFSGKIMRTDAFTVSVEQSKRKS